jgi:hypothetical protein
LGTVCDEYRLGDLASAKMRDNDVAERAKAHPSELNYE